MMIQYTAPQQPSINPLDSIKAFFAGAKVTQHNLGYPINATGLRAESKGSHIAAAMLVDGGQVRFLTAGHNSCSASPEQVWFWLLEQLHLQR